MDEHQILACCIENGEETKMNRTTKNRTWLSLNRGGQVTRKYGTATVQLFRNTNVLTNGSRKVYNRE